MKSFQQFMEQVSPKHYDKTPVTVDDALTNRIRTPDVIKKENQKFRSLYPFPSSFLPTAKKKLSLKRALNLNFLWI